MRRIEYRKDYEEFVNLKRRSGLFISIKPSFTMLVDLISCGRSVRKNKCGKESEKLEKEVSLLTTFTMLLSLAPAAAFAAENGNADNSKKDVNVAVVLDASGKNGTKG